MFEMKRPLTIYLLVLVIAIFVVPSSIFLIASQSGLYLFPFQKEIYQYYLPHSFKLFLWLSTIPMLPAIYGLYRGRSWARNLVFFLLLLWILYIGRGLIPIFSMSSPAEFKGLARFLTMLNLLALSGAFLLFYLMLRPEVGKFCRSYPQTPIKSNQNS